MSRLHIHSRSEESMLQYLSVKRPKHESKDGKLISSLPFNLNSIYELPFSQISISDKFRILLEQAILARYLYDFSDSKNSHVETYLDELYKLYRVSIPRQNNSMDPNTFRSYCETLDGILSNQKSSFYDAISILNDGQHFSKECCTINKDFYVPYLSVYSGRCGGENAKSTPDYLGAMLLVPSLENIDGGQRVTFKPKVFTTCHLYEKITLPYISKSMEYALRLDWKGKNWIQFTDVTQSFGLNVANIFEAHQSLPGKLAAIIRRKDLPVLTNTRVRSQFVTCLKHLEQRYRIDIDSFESLKLVMNGLGYRGLEFLTSENPTNRELEAFENLADLQFIKPYKLQVAFEAAESEKEEEEKPEEQDNLEDDPETDPETETSDDDSADDTTDAGEETPEGESTDESTDDFGMDEGTDESTDTSGGSDSGDGAEQTDTPSDPQDPFSIAFKVTKSETMEDYFQREALCVALTEIVKNPPEEVSGETVAFLRVWLTQWINLVSVDTTKAVLSQLAVKIDL